MDIGSPHPQDGDELGVASPWTGQSRSGSAIFLRYRPDGTNGAKASFKVFGFKLSGKPGDLRTFSADLKMDAGTETIIPSTSSAYPAAQVAQAQAAALARRNGSTPCMYF